jgi:hypothetical protein
MTARVRRSLGFVTAVFLPAAVFVGANTSSLSAGTALACLVALGAEPRRFARLLVRHGAETAVLLALAVFVAWHALVATLWSPINVSRTVGSLLLLCLFFAGADAISWSFFTMRSSIVDRVCRGIVAILFLSVLASALQLVPSGEGGRKLVLPFAEPSHFALAFTPFLLYVCLRQRGWWRYCLILLTFVVGYVVQNLTLLLGGVLVVAITVRARHLPWLLGLLTLAAMQLDLGYFLDRLDFDTASRNLSSLAYMQGWQLIGESLERSSYWGLGFQQLGQQPTSVEAAVLIYQMGQLELNLNDGSFMIAKVVSEFGVFGIALILVLLALMARIALRLRSVTTTGHAALATDLLARCMVLAFALELLVRSTSYFSGTALLFVAAALHLSRQRRISPTSANGRTLPSGRLDRKIEGPPVSHASGRS